MELDLPLEIIQQILPQIRDAPSKMQLHDLRIALTCTTFYRALSPLIAMRQSTLLRMEMDGRKLNFLDGNGASLSSDCVDIVESGEANSTTIAEICFNAIPFESTEAIWSLHSFLSRGDVARKLTRFQLTLHADARDRIRVHGPQRCDRKGWQRALLKLVGLIMSQEGLRFEVAGTEAKEVLIHPPAASSFESLSQDDLTTSRFRFSSLSLSGTLLALLLSPATHPHFRFICLHSQYCLTHLHLNFPRDSEDASARRWDDILDLLKFDNLSHLSICTLTMPPKALMDILGQNQSLATMSIGISEPTNFIPKRPWVPRPVRGEKVLVLPPHEYYLSNLQHLVCHPRMLLALLRTYFCFPNLETLVVCGYSSVEGYYCTIHDITEMLSYLGHDRKPENPKPFSLKLELPYEWYMGLSRWFASASLSPTEFIEEMTIVRALKGFAASKTSSRRFKTYTPMSLAVALRRLHNLESLTLVAQKFSLRDPLPHTENTRRRSRSLDVPPELVARFIAALPAVKDVALHSIFHDLKAGHGEEGLEDIRKELGKIWRMSRTAEKITVFDYGHGELSGRTEVLVRPQ